MQNLPEATENKEVQNYISLILAIKIVTDSLEDYVLTTIRSLHRTIYNQLAAFPNCSNNCSKVENDLQKWCYSCQIWKKEIVKHYRHKHKAKNLNWKQIDSANWQSSEREMMKVYQLEKNSHNSHAVFDDLSSLLCLISNCTEFKIQPQMLKDIRQVRNQYFAHSNCQITCRDLQICLDRLYSFMHVNEIKSTPSGNTGVRKLEYLRLHQHDIIELFRKNPSQSCDESSYKDKGLKGNIVIYDRKNSWNVNHEYNFSVKTVAAVLEHIKIASISKKRNKIWKKALSLPNRLLYTLLCTLLLLFIDVSHYSHDKEEKITTDCVSMTYKFPWSSEINTAGYTRIHDNVVDRQWLISLLEDELLKSNRGVLLTADMGYGKSAIVSRLLCPRTSDAGYWINQRILAFHICKYDVLITQKPEVFIRNLLGKLIREIPELGQSVLTDNSTLGFLEATKCAADPLGCIDFGLLQPLQRFNYMPNIHMKKYIILIDALDECESLIPERHASVFTILDKKIQSFPKWIKFLFTSRNITNISNRLQSIRHIDIIQEDKRNYEDISRYICKQCTNEYFFDLLKQKHDLNDEQTCDYLSRFSRGNFLFIKHIIDQLRNNENLELSFLPSTLQDVYRQHFERVFGIHGEHFNTAKIVFEIIFANTKPLKLTEIMDIANITTEAKRKEFYRHLGSNLQHFINYKSDILHISHKSVQDWLINNDEFSAFHISKSNGHKLMAKFLLKSLNSKMMEEDNITDLIAHAADSDETEIKDSLLFHLRELALVQSLNESLMHIFVRVKNNYNGVRLIKNIFPYLDVDQRNSQNVTAAFIAAAYGHEKSLEALLNLGADIQFKIKFPPFDFHIPTAIRDGKDMFYWGYNLLHISAQNGYFDTVKLLMFRRPSLLKEKNGFNLNAFQLASERGHDGIMQMFLKYNKSLADQFSLHHAAMNGHERAVQLILSNGVKDRCFRCDGTFYWLKNNEVRMQGRLRAESYKSINMKISDAKSAACHQSDENCRNKLNISENSTNYSPVLYDDWWLITCETALIAAVTRGHFGITKLLVNEANNSLNCQDYTGMTPLFTAVKYNRTEIFRYLLSSNSYVNISNRCTFRGINTDKYLLLSDIEVTYYVSNLCPELASITHILAIYDRFEMVKFLYHNGFTDWCIRDKDNVTALHHAACHSSRIMIHFLILKGLNTIDRSSNGSTPFHSAVLCNSLSSIIDLYSEHPVNVSLLKDNEGRDLMHYLFLSKCQDEAKLPSTSDETDVMIYLLHELMYKEYNFKKGDRNGTTAVELALESGHFKKLEFVSLLWKSVNRLIYQNSKLKYPLIEKALQALPNTSGLIFEKVFNARYRDNTKMIETHTSNYENNVLLVLNMISNAKGFVSGDIIHHCMAVAAQKGRLELLETLLIKYGTNDILKYFDMLLKYNNRPVLPLCSTANAVFNCNKKTHNPIHQIIMNRNNRYWYLSPDTEAYFLNCAMDNLTGKELDGCYDGEGYSLVHRAAMGGHFAAIKYLVGKNMNISNVGMNLLSLIIINAPYSSNLKCIQPFSYIVFEDTDIKTRQIVYNNESETINFDISASYVLEISRKQIFASDLCNSTQRKLGLIHTAAAKGLILFLKTVRRLYGRDILKCSNSYGFTSMYFARFFNHSNILDFMNQQMISLRLPDPFMEFVFLQKWMFSFNQPFPRNSTVFICQAPFSQFPIGKSLIKTSKCLKDIHAEMKSMNFSNYNITSTDLDRLILTINKTLFIANDLLFNISTQRKVCLPIFHSKAIFNKFSVRESDHPRNSFTYHGFERTLNPYCQKLIYQQLRVERIFFNFVKKTTTQLSTLLKQRIYLYFQLIRNNNLLHERSRNIINLVAYSNFTFGLKRLDELSKFYSDDRRAFSHLMSDESFDSLIYKDTGKCKQLEIHDLSNDDLSKLREVEIHEVVIRDPDVYFDIHDFPLVKIMKKLT